MPEDTISQLENYFRKIRSGETWLESDAKNLIEALPESQRPDYYRQLEKAKRCYYVSLQVSYYFTK